MRPASVDQAVCSREHLGVLGVALNRGGKVGGREHLVEGVTDVLELVVKFFAAMLEPVLEAFQQIGGKVSAVTRRIAMNGDVA